jgi:hypothetical protein
MVPQVRLSKKGVSEAIRLKFYLYSDGTKLPSAASEAALLTRS